MRATPDSQKSQLSAKLLTALSVWHDTSIISCQSGFGFAFHGARVALRSTPDAAAGGYTSRTDTFLLLKSEESPKPFRNIPAEGDFTTGRVTCQLYSCRKATWRVFL
jgi:hypothetical protein